MYTLGFVDEDQMEIRKVERKLRSYFKLISYDIPQGLSKKDLINQIYSSNIDLLLVDFLMNDKGYLAYNGDEVVRDFEEIKPDFPMIIFTNDENGAFPQVDNPNIIYNKEVLSSNLDKFVKVLEKLIQNYQKKIDNKAERINQLISIRDERELTGKEKDELYRLQYDLNNLDKRNREAPEHLLVKLKLDKLAGTVQQAEEFLKELKNGKIQS